MAEIVVSAVITVLCEKLISGDLMKLARSEGIDSQLNKWKKTLQLIQAVLADAGRKQITERSVQLWLNDLQDLAYDIDDVLDDMATEVIRRKLNQESHASTSISKVSKFIPSCCTNLTPRNILYGRQMSNKLDEITTKLHDLVDQKNDLGLNVNVERSNKTERRLEQTSLVDESKIMGREDDKVALLEKLLWNESSDQNVCVVSIVGMGGIGKTTLAKVLYNEEKVKDHFELRAWVCISEELDVFNISYAIFQAVCGEERRFSNLDLLHVALKEKLVNKRFLLVLDDVWNEDQSKWELLQSPLVGATGSKILVTTRNTRVASVMDSVEAYHLEVLSDKDALSLFAQHALGEKSFEKHPTLKSHGEGIVKKCGRLPLALKTLGKVLKSNRNDDEWERLLNSEIWDIHDGSEILPALRLSYYHLPPHLKLLFAYCSLFPKDIVFDKKELVLLWMAEGFLSQENGNKSMESSGYRYFEELKSRSFFQHSTNGELGYMMHDLINDLATSVAGEFFFRLDEEMDASERNQTFEKFRHFSFIGPRWAAYKKLNKLQRARRLRTFLHIQVGWGSHGLLDKDLADLLPLLKFLRVLSLTNRIITGVPQSIGSLKHLRYLNFSNTGITSLPDQVGDLYNLQSLLLRSCYELRSLPKSFVKLINLQHLDITGTPKLNKMPLGIGGLTSLRTLIKVIIEGPNGFEISDLKGLSDLEGRLSIMGLEKVINPMEAKDANLHQKKGLDVLEMKWSDVFDDSRNEMIEYKVLEGLRPHHKLRNLNIWFYMGTRFPNWVGDPSFDQLTELTLRGCRSRHLPTLGHLRSLRKLFVERMNEVKTLGLELLAPSNSFIGIAFPSLEVLKFDNMQGWERWSTSGGNNTITTTSFPCLHEISIKRCPKLAQVSVGLIPSLSVLHIEECSEVVLKSMVSVSSSLVALKMLCIKGFTQLHGEDLIHLGAVKDLYIDNCDELKHLWEPTLEVSKILGSLQKLEVSYCEKLVSLGEKEVNLGINMQSVKEVILRSCDTMESYSCPNSVERLVIDSCRSMTSFTFSTVHKLSSSLTESVISDCDNIEPIPEKDFDFLPNFFLTSLHIVNCKKLKSFPQEHFQCFTSLEQLLIHDCPSMDYSFPSGLWPPNLRTLHIGCLKKPMSEWGPQNFPPSLVTLHLYGKNSGVVSFQVAEAEDMKNTTSASFLLPRSLVSLALIGFMEVKSLSEVLQHLTCLKRLDIWECPKLRGVHDTTSKPSSLTIRAW